MIDTSALFDPCKSPYLTRIIFLDIDGVLNGDWWMKECERTGDTSLFSPTHVQRLHKLVQRTGAKIVLTSTYRKLKETRDILWEQGVLTPDNVLPPTDTQNPYYDPRFATTGWHARCRGLEIEEFIKTLNPPYPLRYIIIDDSCNDFLKGQHENIFCMLGQYSFGNNFVNMVRHFTKPLTADESKKIALAAIADMQQSESRLRHALSIGCALIGGTSLNTPDDFLSALADGKVNIESENAAHQYADLLRNARVAIESVR